MTGGKSYGKICSVDRCKNQEGKAKGISFFSFPKDQNVQREWIQKCYRKKQINPKFARICSVHFLPSDFERNLKAELLNIPSRRKLKRTAVPSLLLKNNEDVAVSTARDERAHKRERKRIIEAIFKQREELELHSVVNINKPGHSHFIKSEYSCTVVQQQTQIMNNKNYELKKELADYSDCEKEIKQEALYIKLENEIERCETI